MIRYLAVFLLISISAFESFSQLHDMPVQTIKSSILGEERELLIRTPAKMQHPIPLIIVFDGEGLFEPVASAQRFMTTYSQMPQMSEAIIVGIVNTDRNRDMPRPQDYGKRTGEENFGRFIKDELMPWVSKNFKFNGHVITVGHSQGAYFVSYLLARYPEIFSWPIAIDAPMNVDVCSIALKDQIGKNMKTRKYKVRYASLEATYGWESEWKKYFSDQDEARQIKIEGETHESVAFKAAYDGLHFLFSDFTPPQKDFSLTQLQDYYKMIFEKYGYHYEIPFRILMLSAGRKKIENRKQELIDLAGYMEDKYGSSTTIENLKNAASTMTQDGAVLLDKYINSARPTDKDIKPYLGIWTGKAHRIQPPPVKMPREEGTLSIEISIENGKAILTRIDPPWAQGKKVEMEVFYLTKDGELVFGYHNRGGGVIISKTRLNKKGNLEGNTRLEGFNIPAKMDDWGKQFHEYIINNPEVFELTRK